MRPDHLTPVKALLDLCFFESTWSMNMLSDELQKPEASCTVAVEDGAVVGFLAFERILDEGSVIELAVHPDFRRRGIACDLLRHAMNGPKPLSTVFLEVRAANIPAITLYERLGFQQIAVRKNYYAHPAEDAVVMKKSLPLEVPPVGGMSEGQGEEPFRRGKGATRRVTDEVGAFPLHPFN